MIEVRVVAWFTDKYVNDYMQIGYLPQEWAPAQPQTGLALTTGGKTGLVTIDKGKTEIMVKLNNPPGAGEKICALIFPYETK